MNASFAPYQPAPKPATPDGSEKRRKARHFPRSGMVVYIIFLRVAALAVLGAFGYFFVQLMLTRDPVTGYIALGLLGTFLFLRVAAFLKASHLHCPLCHGTVLRANTCHKHRDAHRLPLLGLFWTAAVDVLTRAHFRCMYCGTPFRLKK